MMANLQVLIVLLLLLVVVLLLVVHNRRKFRCHKSLSCARYSVSTSDATFDVRCSHHSPQQKLIAADEAARQGIPVT